MWHSYTQQKGDTTVRDTGIYRSKVTQQKGGTQQKGDAEVCNSE